MRDFQLESKYLQYISEEDRLRELFSFDILDTQRDSRFDEILERICEQMGAIAGRFSLIDADRIWVKASKQQNKQILLREGSIENILIEKNLEITSLSKNQTGGVFADPAGIENPQIQTLFAIAIRSTSGAIVGALVLGFEREFEMSDELSLLFLASASKYSDLLESRRVADALLATMREQQDELRVRYSSERIARTLTNPVSSQGQYRQVIESFAQTILNEFDWWGCQIWLEEGGNLSPEKWLFGPSTPITLKRLDKLFIQPILAPKNSATQLGSYVTTTTSIISSRDLDWFENSELLESSGARTVVVVDVTGLSLTSIRLLFILPNARAMPPRLKLTFDNVAAILPQVLRRARTTEEMNYRATHDELTGLLNRRGLDIEFTRSPRHEGINTSRTVFFLDIDRFKSINDTYGHQVGDEFLVEIAHRLLKTSRPVDAIARIGGDEFVIIAQGFDMSEDIEKISERFLRNVGAPFVMASGIQIEPRISIGVANWNVTENLVGAISQADKNMYLAKERGGHQAVAEGWVSSNSGVEGNGDSYAITYQNIVNNQESRVLGTLARVRLPFFFAPKVISNIAEEIYRHVTTLLEADSSTSVLILEITTASRSDRANTLALVDSVAELSSKHSHISLVINLDSTQIDGIPLAREILRHGTSRIAFGNIFEHPFDLSLLDELNPSFLIQSSASLELPEGNIPNIAERSTLAIASELNIPVILPIQYASRYGDYLARYPQTIYLDKKGEQ